MKFFYFVVNFVITMKNRNKIKLILMLMLAGAPIAAQQQTPDDKKRSARTERFARLLLYWADYDAYDSVKMREKRIAEKMPYDSAANKIPDLVRDSTYYADIIKSGADLINKRYSLRETPDNVYTLYELMYIYEEKHTDKNSSEYILIDNLMKYVDVLKQLKLNRYTMEVNKK